MIFGFKCCCEVTFRGFETGACDSAIYRFGSGVVETVSGRVGDLGGLVGLGGREKRRGIFRGG